MLHMIADIGSSTFGMKSLGVLITLILLAVALVIGCVVKCQHKKRLTVLLNALPEIEAVEGRTDPDTCRDIVEFYRLIARLESEDTPVEEPSTVCLVRGADGVLYLRMDPELAAMGSASEDVVNEDEDLPPRYSVLFLEHPDEVNPETM